MEIKIYRSMKHLTADKPLMCVRVSFPDEFDLNSSLKVFRCLYGHDIVIVLVCV